MSHSGLWFVVFGGGEKRILQKNPTLFRYIACRKPFSVRESLSLSNKSLPFPRHLTFIFSSNLFFFSSLLSQFFSPYLIGFLRSSSPSDNSFFLMRSSSHQSLNAIPLFFFALLFALLRGFFRLQRCGLLIHPYPCLKFLAFPVSSFIHPLFLRFLLWAFILPQLFSRLVFG